MFVFYFRSQLILPMKYIYDTYLTTTYDTYDSYLMNRFIPAKLGNLRSQIKPKANKLTFFTRDNMRTELTQLHISHDY